MKSKKIIIGSRGSKLALIYAEIAKKEIISSSTELKEENIEIKKITTKGDQVQDQRLSDVGGKGLFSKKIEEELLENKIDIAVKINKIFFEILIMIFKYKLVKINFKFF